MKSMRKWLALVIIALMFITAQAENIDNSHYTNVPGTTTQDAVTGCSAEILINDSFSAAWSMEFLQPDALTLAALLDIYDFVLENSVMPARYFPEDVQQEIREILDGADPEILHMSEFMSVLPESVAVEDGVARVQLVFDVDYQPGQLVVVMFGDIDEVDPSVLTEAEIRQIEWTPLPAEVVQPGVIEFTIPHTLLMDIQAQQTMFNVLTDRRGGRGSGESGYTETPAQVIVPSKNASDMTIISNEYYNAGGEPLSDDFRIYLTEKTPVMQEEIRRIENYIQPAGSEPRPIAGWFSDEVINEVSLFAGADFDTDTLLAYEIKAVAAENYIDTYGDVRTAFQFATPYRDGQTIVSVLGVPSENPDGANGTQMEWTVLNTVVEDSMTKITFKQLLIPTMEEESLLLIVLSEPIDSETAK